MPAGRDVLFATALVVIGKLSFCNRDRAVVDDAHLRLVGNAIDIAFIQGPGIEPAFGAILGVDRTTIETKRLGLAVPVTGGQPGGASVGKTCLGRLRNQAVDRCLQNARGVQRVLIAGEDEFGIVLRHTGRADCSRRGSENRGRQQRQQQAAKKEASVQRQLPRKGG